MDVGWSSSHAAKRSVVAGWQTGGEMTLPVRETAYTMAGVWLEAQMALTMASPMPRF